MGTVFVFVILSIPFGLTIWNIVAFTTFFYKKKENKGTKFVEVISIFIGLIYLYMYIEINNIKYVSWSTQLYNDERHSMVAPNGVITVLSVCLIAFLGYIVIRFISADKQSPIVSAFGIAAIYLGVFACVVWCVQTIHDFFLILFPANCILIFIKTVYIVVYQKNALIQNKKASIKYKKLSDILNNALNLPWIALLLVLPLLGVLIFVLFLFGQEPDSIIKAWTETADWTFSQKIAPQNIQYDEHYLCTVAAGGHKMIVKPIRTGKRHGHRVIVNRQLCVANAFEQVIEEKAPQLHRIIRKIYDSTGYPVAKHIRSKRTADVIYFMMKPLEWLFLIILYTVDVCPENRIAVQYPHTNIPTI